MPDVYPLRSRPKRWMRCVRALKSASARCAAMTAPQIQEAVYNLRHALQKHRGHWSPEEIQRVRDLLDATAKAIIDGPDRPLFWSQANDRSRSNTIHRVSHEIKRRRLQVLRVEDLTPRMRRITVGGPELAGFVSLGTDDHVKLLFRRTPRNRPPWNTSAPAPASTRPRARCPRCATTPRAAMTWTAWNWTSISCSMATARPRPGRPRRRQGNPLHRRATGLDGRAGHLRQLPADR